MDKIISGHSHVRKSNVIGNKELKPAVIISKGKQLPGKDIKLNSYSYIDIFKGLAISIWKVDLSETRKILCEIQRQERDLRKYLENHREMLPKIIKSIRFLEVNEWTVKHYKAADNEHLFSNFQRLISFKTWPLIFDMAVAITEGDQSFSGETCILDLQGKSYPSLVNVCFHGGDNDYSNVIWGVVDITSQKESEEEIRRSEERLRTILKTIPDLIYLFDRDGYYLDYYASDVGKNKMNPKGIGGHHVKDIFPDNIVESILTSFDNSLKTSDIQSFEDDVTGNGRHTYYEYKIVPAGFDEVIVMVTDITDRKIAERVRNTTYRISELAMTSQSLDELYKSIHNVIGELMPAHNIYIALYDPEANSLSFPYFVDEHDQAPPSRQLKKGLTEYVLHTGKPILTNPLIINQLVSKGEIEIMGTLTYDWLGVPLKTKERTIGVLVIQSYNDEIRYSESDKEMLIFVSEQIAMAIERRKSKEELIYAKTAAEGSSKLKSTLLANLSHEFRTPMNGILNYAYLLKEGLKGDPMESMAEMIYNSGNRLMTTLDSIMNLAQIEASNVKLEIQKADIGNSIHTTVLHYETEANEKGLLFEYDLRDEIFAYCDVTLINQIAKYLLDNAVKFTKEGKISVFVRPVFQEDKAWAELEVKDTGMGISKQDSEVIFHEFWQVSSGYGRNYEGSGLGLTLCKKMVELMNGRILVDSNIGIGSSFFVRLPLDTDRHTTPKRVVKETEPENAVHTAKRKDSDRADAKYNVLVVEDNQVNMELTVMFLKGLCNTDRARDGETAIQMASLKKYDAILMDINLGPGMNGLEAAQRIKKLKDYENTPIIAVTGYTLTGDREKMLRGGCTHYLPKPFDKKGIINMLKEALAEKNA